MSRCDGAKNHTCGWCVCVCGGGEIDRVVKGTRVVSEGYGHVIYS